jgi:hypothetical protein
MPASSVRSAAGASPTVRGSTFASDVCSAPPTASARSDCAQCDRLTGAYARVRRHSGRPEPSAAGNGRARAPTYLGATLRSAHVTASHVSTRVRSKGTVRKSTPQRGWAAPVKRLRLVRRYCCLRSHPQHTVVRVRERACACGCLGRRAGPPAILVVKQRKTLCGAAGSSAHLQTNKQTNKHTEVRLSIGARSAVRIYYVRI